MKYGIDTITFKVLQIWQDILKETRNWESLSLFKANIKQVQNVDFN